MAGSERWYYTSEQLNFSPSRKAGMDADMELSYRQRAANLIQDMGQRIQVSQLCINTAIVYMHRFYVFHSFTKFHRNSMAAASLFLAAKVEEQPRKIEHIIKALNSCLNGGEMSRDKYNEQAQDLVLNENILLQTLGFDVAIDHPHTYVVKTMQLVGASKDLAQTSYFMASNSLHLTTMCLQYKPTVVACFCIHLACQWSRWEIPRSSEGKSWFYYVDKSITMDLLKQLTDEFLYIFEKCPSRLKSKMNSVSQNAQTVERPISIKEDSNQSNSKHHQTHHHPHHQHHQHPHPHHQHHNKDHRSHKTGEKVNVQASTSSQGSNNSKIPPQGQQQLSQSSSNKSSTNQKIPGIHQQHPQSSSSSSAKPPNHSHDPNQKQRSHNIYMENVHKNRPNYPGNQSGMPSQKVSDQRHPKGPPGGDIQNSSSSKGSSKSSMYPNSANQDQYPPRSSSSSNSSNNSKSSLVYQQMSGSGNVKNQQSASVPMKSKNETTSSNKSFSLVDDSSHILDTMPRNDNSASSKAAPTSIFDPDYDGEIQAKSNKSSSLLKPNKDSPNKEKRSNTPSKKERRADTPTGMSLQSSTSNWRVPKFDLQQKSSKEESRDARFTLMSGKSNSSPALPIKEDKLAIQQQREQQHLQRQIQNKQNQRSTNVFDAIPGQKRPFSHLETSSSSSFDAKKQKLSTNDFFESDFDAVFEGSTFGNNNMVASNVDFSGHHNDNANSQTQFDNSFNQKETAAKVVQVAAKESNPDFVKSLLQESFSNQDNKFLSTVDTNELKRCIQIPEELPEDLLAPVPAPLAPIAPITSIQPIVKQQPVPPIQETISTLPNIQTENMDSEGSEYHRKSKKKKEKHKHKERSKDKEERKKHKKDKDKDRHRHKHRDRDEVDGQNAMKVMGPEQPLKIKISKDVFDRQTVSANGVAAAPAAAYPLPTDSSIKIKIPKDKIKNYNDNSANYNSSSSSHKKNKEKDRDKDRSRDKDKEKEKDRAKNSSSTRHSVTLETQQQQQPQATQPINKIPFNSMNYDYANMMSSGATKPPPTQFQRQQQQQQQQIQQQQYQQQQQQYHQQQHQMQQHPQLNHQLMQQSITDNMYFSNVPQQPQQQQPNQWQQEIKMIREMVARKQQNK